MLRRHKTTPGPGERDQVSGPTAHDHSLQSPFSLTGAKVLYQPLREWYPLEQ